MTYPETGYNCPRCTMHFRLVSEFRSYGEVTRCSAPRCALRFWHGGADHKPLVTEMLQGDLEA